jgi:hypothetical protein
MSIELIKELESFDFGADSYFDIEDIEDTEIIEEGDFVSEGKYEVCETVFKYKGELFSVVQSRSGSYYTDYYYDTPSFYAVEPKVITKTVYVRV